MDPLAYQPLPDFIAVLLDPTNSLLGSVSIYDNYVAEMTQFAGLTLNVSLQGVIDDTERNYNR